MLKYNCKVLYLSISIFCSFTLPLHFGSEGNIVLLLCLKTLVTLQIRIIKAKYSQLIKDEVSLQIKVPAGYKVIKMSSTFTSCNIKVMNTLQFFSIANKLRSILKPLFQNSSYSLHHQRPNSSSHLQNSLRPPVLLFLFLLEAVCVSVCSDLTGQQTLLEETENLISSTETFSQSVGADFLSLSAETFHCWNVKPPQKPPGFDFYCV